MLVLGDDRLHQFIGGRPETLAELRERYLRLQAGSLDDTERWCNWVLRSRTELTAVGTIQATVKQGDDGPTAEVAWVIGVGWQDRGFATEAAVALVDWLLRQGAGEIIAKIHPAHRASAAVATRAGLTLTTEQSGGESVWRRTVTPG